MIRPKYFSFISVLFIIGSMTTITVAQDYSIKAKSLRINDVKYDGFSINVIGPVEKVSGRVFDNFKDKFKIKRKRDYFSVAEFELPNQSIDSTQLFIRIIENTASSSIWIAAKTDELEEDAIAKINSTLKDELVKLARSYYVYEQGLKIKEAETAAQIVSRNQQNLIKEKERLSKKLTRAQARKIELETLLEKNKLAISMLKQKLIDNTVNQDSTYLDLQKINRIMDEHKLNLKDIK